jgi:hypothetical protein
MFPMPRLPRREGAPHLSEGVSGGTVKTASKDIVGEATEVTEASRSEDAAEGTLAGLAGGTAGGTMGGTAEVAAGVTEGGDGETAVLRGRAAAGGAAGTG